MRITRHEGRNRDFMAIAPVLIPAGAAGTGADFEYDLFVVPDDTVAYPAGSKGLTPNNWVTLKTLNILASVLVTGVATNNFGLYFYQRRAGALLVNTTAPTTVVAGSQVVTPASMANIVVGSQLVFAGGVGATETVTVTAVTATTFTATFANGHSGGYTITSAPVLSIVFAAGTNLAAHTPTQLAATLNSVMNQFKSGDVLTVARVSSGTGLASPAMTIQPEWVPWN